MKNYANSDYALNKVNKDAIVYRFADGIVEVTLTDYLAENPDKAEADFRTLKKLSDADYLERDRRENVQTKKNTPFSESEETDLCCTPSPEVVIIGEIDSREEAELRKQRLATAHRALDRLTEVQRRRYLQYHVDGLTIREIAKNESAYPNAVQESLQAAEKKIKKNLAKG